MDNDKSGVTDRFNRPLRDLRISVTDRCNFRCTYCMPAEIFGPDYPFLKQQQLLSYEEITRIARIFVNLGVSKLRITGGEPLMRKELDRLIAMLAEINGVKDIAMTTNGSLLPNKAKSLKSAGLNRVTVSLDSLDDETFGQLNGRGVKVGAVLKGIEMAEEAGLAVKINMLVKRGINENEIVPMARFFQGKDHVLRFIEYMDVGSSNGWTLDEVVTKEEMLEKFQKEWTMEPIEPNYFGEVVSRYRIQDTGQEIGIISSISAPFCSSCTRARLSADGKVYACLFATDGVDLRRLLRKGEDEQVLLQQIRQIWAARQDRYSVERTNQTNQLLNKKKIEMSYIGG